MSISQSNTKMNEFTDKENDITKTPPAEPKEKKEKIEKVVKHVIFDPVVDIVFIENFKALYNQLENQCERVAMNKRSRCVSCGCIII